LIGGYKVHIQRRRSKAYLDFLVPARETAFATSIWGKHHNLTSRGLMQAGGDRVEYEGMRTMSKVCRLN
jgi:hypothetical protein